MLIEAYAMRMSTDSAHEIATHICEVARDGVNIRPEELEPKKEEAVKAEKQHLLGLFLKELFLEMDILNMS